MKYTGRLREPITRRAMGLLEDDEAHHVESKRITDEMFAKLPDLFQSHGVPDGDWITLVMEMAKAHVPGFRLINGAGRKTEWSFVDKAEFRLDVDAIVSGLGGALPITEAIKLACRKEAWADKTKAMTLPAVTRHYYAADMRFVETVKRARLWEIHLEIGKTYESIVSTN